MLLLLLPNINWGQISHSVFLQDDVVCIENEDITISEVSILRNDTQNGFTPFNDFTIEIDTTFIPQYGTGSISRITADNIVGFGGSIIAYDTVMVRYEYSKTSDLNLIDTIRYIITDYTTNTRDSAFVIFDIGCQSGVTPIDIHCSQDTLIITSAPSCDTEYFIKAPTVNGTVVEGPNFFSRYTGSGPGTTLKLPVGMNDRVITFFKNGIQGVCETYVEVIEKPTITCPQNITSCHPIVSWQEPEAIFSCPNSQNIYLTPVNPLLSSGTSFPDGITTVTYTSPATLGIDTTCSFDVEIVNAGQANWKNNISEATVCPDDLVLNLEDQLETTAPGQWTSNSPEGIFEIKPEYANSTQTVEYTLSKTAINSPLICTESISYNVTILPYPVINVSKVDSIICKYNSPIDLNILYVTDPQNGTWLIGQNENDIFNPHNLGNGNYKVKYTQNTLNCPKSFTQTLVVNSPSEIETNILNCDNSLLLEASSTSLDSIISSSSDINWEPTEKGLILRASYGLHTLKTIDFEGLKCISINNNNITFYEEPSIPDAGEDITLEYDETNFTMNATPPESGIGKWIYDSQNVRINSTNDEQSEATYLSNNGTTIIWEVSNGNCPSVSDSLFVTKNNLVIPEAFSPNGDDINDYFEILGIENISIGLEIMNRWGQSVYTSSDYKNDWNGKSNSSNTLVSDTYYYRIIIAGNQDLKGKIFIKR